MNIKLTGTEQKVKLKGAYNNHIRLTIFPKKIYRCAHIVMLALYKEQLLFTRHKQRGMEWPGGKLEQGETPVQAAIRELLEETGGVVGSIWLIGQYEVRQSNMAFMKNIYVVQVSEMRPEWQCGSDTEGAVLVPINVQPKVSKGYSPLVCDGVFEKVRAAIIDLHST